MLRPRKKLLASQLDVRIEISALQRQIEERVAVKRTLFSKEIEVQESTSAAPMCSPGSSRTRSSSVRWMPWLPAPTVCATHTLRALASLAPTDEGLCPGPRMARVGWQCDTHRYNLHVPIVTTDVTACRVPYQNSSGCFVVVTRVHT
eukprot:1084428-Prymnesium_polylepis.1